MIAVVKLGSSSVTEETVARLCGEIVAARRAGHTVVVVTSGAIAAGWAALDHGGQRSADPAVLQAVSAVGGHRLIHTSQDGSEPTPLSTTRPASADMAARRCRYSAAMPGIRPAAVWLPKPAASNAFKAVCQKLSSPAPLTCACEARICSHREVPDLGMPTMKTGRSVDWPKACSRWSLAGSNVPMMRLTRAVRLALS